MSYGKLLEAGAMALVSLTVLGAGGCSSSSASGENGAPTDASSDVLGVRHPDGSGAALDGGDDAGDDSGAIGNDGTSGKPCQTNADCKGAGGPDANVCSNDPKGLNGTGNAIFPTPICFDPTPCNLPLDGNLHFCDGPDDPSSPGICMPGNTGTQGFCMPKCTFKPDGSPATGCAGKNACNYYVPLQDPMTNALTGGLGYCFGGSCSQDSDCPAGDKCQANLGECLGMATLPLEPLGTACNPLSTNSTNACNCYSNVNSTSDLGYCAQACVVGVDDCPAGTVCDAQLPTSFTTPSDASVAGFTKQSAGLSGYCIPTCSAAAGDAGTGDGGAGGAGTGEAGAVEGGTCGGYFNASCQGGTAAGPDCQPM
jgi:hypothetical protein